MFNIITKKTIGIDIADHSIEVVELKKVGSRISVNKISRINLQSGIVKNGRIINEEELAKFLREAMLNAQPKPITAKKIIFGFPESQTFFHTFTYDLAEKEKTLSKEDMDRVVLEEAWLNIPIVRNEMSVYYQILNESKDKVDFLVVATMKRIAVEWQDFFDKVGLDVQTFDIEALANFRSISEESKKPLCVIDIGAAITNVYIFSRKKLVHEHTINIAGEDFTNEIAMVLKTSREDAENKKIDIGLSDSDSLFFNSLVKILGGLSSEIKKSIDYFEKKYSTKIAKLILIGGSSQLKGLPEYFTSNFGIPTSLGMSKYLKDKKLEYIGAVGMALRGLNKKVDEDDPVIPFVEEGNFSEDDENILDINKQCQNEDDLAPKTKFKEKKYYKKILLVILVGIIFFGSAFYYRKYEKDKKQAELKAARDKIENIDIYQDDVKTEAATSTQNNKDMDNANNAEDKVSSSSILSDISEKVVIKETEVGYLNVREGAGKNFSVVTKVVPGEAYELLESQSEWTKIKISESLSGWVANKYIERK